MTFSKRVITCLSLDKPTVEAYFLGVLAQDLHPAIREALGCHEGFRKLGFLAADIYVGLQAGMMIIMLETQGKQFVVGTGKMALTEDQFHDAWEKATTAIANGDLPDEEFDKIWTTSMPYLAPMEFVSAILRKGLVIPATNKFLN